MADHTPPDDRIAERLTVSQAADRLGITEGAVRGRINRGTLEVEREGGTVYVLLYDQTTDEHTGEYNALISQLRSEIVYLREENQRKDHLLAAALERIPPQLEAPESPREAPETATVGGTEQHSAGGQEGAQRPWWRRMFGG